MHLNAMTSEEGGMARWSIISMIYGMCFVKKMAVHWGPFQVSQLLQVTFTDGVHVSAGKTKVPDALWFFADAIKGDIRASSIAETFFAKDIKAIQEARQKRSK